MGVPQQIVVILAIFMALVDVNLGSGTIPRDVKGNANWERARATFYGDMGGSETMYGACGYGDLFKQGYGLATAALSTALFNNGATCGACFEIMCINEPKWSWCIPNAGSIKITATNFCPPNYTKTESIWCNPPQKHFDLSMKMFTTIAYYKAGVIPIYFRQVTCWRQGGVKFEIKGNLYWNLVLVYNVGGVGVVVDVKIKGSNTNWIQMSRNWGQNWQTRAVLTGQTLSFQVTTSDRKMIWFDNIVPANWKFGQTYDGGKNF